MMSVLSTPITVSVNSDGLRRFTGPPTRDATIRGGAKQYRTFMPFLLLAHEAGVLDELEQRA